MRCFFHDVNGVPRVTIGPNWGFTIVLSLLVSLVLYISLNGMVNLNKIHAAWYY